MLHDILENDHIQWHTPLMGHYTNFWPFTDLDLITEFDFLPNCVRFEFHKTFATGVACQKRTLTLPDTRSCPTLRLACVLMSRPISPELVLFPDFWVSNIPLYFCFASLKWTMSFKNQENHLTEWLAIPYRHVFFDIDHRPVRFHKNKDSL